MPKHKVLLTDYHWPELTIERDLLAAVDAELSVAMHSDPRSLARIASRGFDAVMTCWAAVDRRVIEASGCRIVSRFGIGVDNIDLDHCSDRGVVVTNVPDYCITEVAEHTLALLLGLGRKIAWYHAATKANQYDLQAGPPLQRIAGQTLGIVGLGRIGQAVAARATALGMRVIGYNRTPRAIEGVEQVGWRALLEKSDYLSLHVPLTPDTRHLINAEAIARMRPTAYLINTARGGLVDHVALTDALQRNRLAGAALDVQDPEPPDLTQPPYNLPQVIVTPHAAFVSRQSIDTLRRQATSQTADFLSGNTPANVVQ